MRVFYRCVRCVLTVYRQTRVSFCCEAMREKWGRLFGFGARDVDTCTSREVNLFIDLCAGEWANGP